MRCFFLCLILFGPFFVSPVEAKSRFEIKQMVMREALDNETVPVSLALAVAKVESDFNAKALSSAGARGVMQIMPQTAKGEFDVPAHRLWDAALNIELGIRFLEQLYEQYDGRWDLALSHYNGGTITNGRPHSYTETYLKRVEKWQRVYREQAKLWGLEETLNLAEKTERSWQEPLEEDRFLAWRDTSRFKPSDNRWDQPSRSDYARMDRPRSWKRPPPPRNRFDQRPRPRRGFY